MPLRRARDLTDTQLRHLLLASLHPTVAVDAWGADRETLVEMASSNGIDVLSKAQLEEVGPAQRGVDPQTAKFEKQPAARRSDLQSPLARGLDAAHHDAHVQPLFRKGRCSSDGRFAGGGRRLSAGEYDGELADGAGGGFEQGGRGGRCAVLERPVLERPVLERRSWSVWERLLCVIAGAHVDGRGRGGLGLVAKLGAPDVERLYRSSGGA